MSAIRRVGKKSDPKIREKILSYFPDHESYFEPCVGGGGMFFGKKRAKYNFLNDLDNDVFNAFNVIQNHRNELIEYLKYVPYSDKVFLYFRNLKPRTNIEQAVKFLILSNWSFYGAGHTLRLESGNNRAQLFQQIETTYLSLCESENQWTNTDSLSFFNKIQIKNKTELAKSFAYLDPPYLNTANNYNTPKWTESDVVAHLDLMKNHGMRMAMSEFDHPFVVSEAEKRGLKIIVIGERQNMKNRRTEILIINYTPPTVNVQSKMF
jgi:DNA adenine methylase